jgi:outer membrane lipoprotein-sorting protein
LTWRKEGRQVCFYGFDGFSLGGTLMLRKSLITCVFLGLAATLAAAADAKPAPAKLSAAEIVDKTVAARGGLEAWRAVKTLSLKGVLQAGGNNEPTLSVPVPGHKPGEPLSTTRLQEQAKLPFVMDLKRPRKMRMEIQFNGKTAVQVYDGTNGWKLRPFLNRHDVEPYTAEERKDAALQADLDGPLVDYAAKGTQIQVEGTEKVENRDTYKLKLTLKGGQVQHVWVDAQTFLEAKIEGTPRRLDGKYHPVATYFRDYRQVSGLVVPYVLETAVDGVKQTEKIEIESVTVGPKLDDSLFAKLQ